MGIFFRDHSRISAVTWRDGKYDVLYYSGEV